jgi:hypothetical protein
MSSARPFKVLKMIELNNYIIKLSLNFDDISSTFDMKDLVIYKTQQLIPGNLFETPNSLSLSLAKKQYLNTTLNAQVVFIRDDELQRILIYELDNQFQIMSKLYIYKSIIGVILNYTQRGRISLTPGELVGTPDL